MLERMMNILWCLAFLLQDDPRVLEQKARDRATEMRQECAAALESVDGVGSVGMGGTGTDYRLLIVCRDVAIQRHVRELIGGDEYGGVRIVWSIADPTRRPPPPPEPFNEKPRVQQPEPPPQFPEAQNVWKASVTDCDIIRDHLKMKKVTHPAGNGKSWVPCQVMTRTTIGPVGSYSFTYTNHRPDCPVRLGRVGEPSWSDNYMAWVFRQGITAPKQGNLGIQGDPWTTAAMAAADMASRLPNIREGAGATAWPYPYYYWPYGYWPYYYGPYYYPYRYRYYWRPHYYYPLRYCHYYRFRCR
jgi:hypothetical protein